MAKKPSKERMDTTATELSRDTNDLIKAFRATASFSLPEGGLCSEVHLAAFLGCPRRTVVDALIHPEEGDGIPYVSAGSRMVFSVAAAVAAVERMARSQGRQRRKGGRLKKSECLSNGEREPR
jgi:hypothetical protein